MNTIKVKNYESESENYTGIIEWECGDKNWYKNGDLHREDGPAYVGINGYKVWYLEGKFIWCPNDKLDLTNKIVLSKAQHPLYPTLQIWKILDKDKVWEKTIIPGMEEYILE